MKLALCAKGSVVRSRLASASGFEVCLLPACFICIVYGMFHGGARWVSASSGGFVLLFGLFGMLRGILDCCQHVVFLGFF